MAHISKTRKVNKNSKRKKEEEEKKKEKHPQTTHLIRILCRQPLFAVATGRLTFNRFKRSQCNATCQDAHLWRRIARRRARRRVGSQTNGDQRRCCGRRATGKIRRCANVATHVVAAARRRRTAARRARRQSIGAQRADDSHAAIATTAAVCNAMILTVQQRKRVGGVGRLRRRASQRRVRIAGAVGHKRKRTSAFTAAANQCGRHLRHRAKRSAANAHVVVARRSSSQPFVGRQFKRIHTIAVSQCVQHATIECECDVRSDRLDVVCTAQRRIRSVAVETRRICFQHTCCNTWRIVSKAAKQINAIVVCVGDGCRAKVTMTLKIVCQPLF